MRKIHSARLVLLLGSLACNLASLPPLPGADSVGTAAAQTIEAATPPANN